jgi:hypothetical protein
MVAILHARAERARDDLVNATGGAMTEQETAESKDRPITDQEARPERTRARARAEELWHIASDALRKPTIGAGVAGVAVLAAGAIWGVTEAALAAAAGWAVYRALKRRGGREVPAEAG